ncbi:MAG TPA: MGMT family protein, partial [Arenimonas sp.]|nr:MGMT family protein [Arenimonas sp.]
MWFDQFKTPIGLLHVACDDSGLRFVMFENNKYDAPHRSDWKRDTVATREAREQLLQYFSGDRTEFDLVLNPVGTDFQKQIWHTLAKIPFGETWSYGQLANKIGSPKAVR